MNQMQFIQLCKTLYDMFGEHPDEQPIFHALATVGTLLLQIGEVGKKFLVRSDRHLYSVSTETDANEQVTTAHDTSAETKDVVSQIKEACAPVGEAFASVGEACAPNDDVCAPANELKNCETTTAFIESEQEEATCDSPIKTDIVIVQQEKSEETTIGACGEIVAEDKQKMTSLAAELEQATMDVSAELSAADDVKPEVVDVSERQDDKVSASEDVEGLGYVNIDSKCVLDNTSGADDNESFVHIDDSLVDALSEGANQIGDSRFYVALTNEKADNKSDSPSSKNPSSSQIDWDWSITFEQFLASMLTEQPLVGYFDTKVTLTQSIEKFRNRRLLERTVSHEVAGKTSNRK